MTVGEPEIAQRSAVRSQLIGGDCLGMNAAVAEQLAQQFRRRLPVASLLDKDIEHLAFVIDSAPEIDHAAGDFQIRLIQMRCCTAWGGACANRLLSWDRNDLPSAE